MLISQGRTAKQIYKYFMQRDTIDEKEARLILKAHGVEIADPQEIPFSRQAELVDLSEKDL